MDKNTDVKQLRASLAAACMGRWGTGLDVLDIEEATDEDIIEMAKGKAFQKAAGIDFGNR